MIFINNVLGYRISFDLVSFWYDETTGETNLTGYTRYEELGMPQKWAKNRRNCYYGSRLHFYRSLVANQLYEQGFSTFLIRAIADTAAKRLPDEEGDDNTGGVMEVVPVTARQILFIDSTNNFSISIAGRLLVQYDKDPASKMFLQRFIAVEGSLSKGIEAYILFKGNHIGLNSAGVLSDPSDISYSGYWMYEKAANILPYDYEIE